MTTLSTGTTTTSAYVLVPDTTGDFVLKTGSGTGTPALTLDASQTVIPAQNINFTGTAARITGDMSSATFANRLAFQSNVLNGNSNIAVLPNGTATSSNLVAYNNSDPTNSAYAQVGTTNTESVIVSGVRGTGTYLPLSFYTGNLPQLSIDTSGNATFAVSASGGSNFLIPNADVFRLNAGLAGLNATGAQSMLGVGITLKANTVYAFELVYGINKTAGVTSHTISLSFGGTATVNNIAYTITRIGSGTTFVDTSVTSLTYFVQTAAATTLTSAITTAGRYDIGNVKGTVSIGAAGTFIPQYTLSAAPGGAYTTAPGSFMIIYPIGTAGSNVNIGGWE
jgi:hypothetical protein